MLITFLIHLGRVRLCAFDWVTITSCYMALGSSMHCWYAFMICVPVLLANTTRFFQHSICNFHSLSMSDTFFCLLFLSVNVNRCFRRFGGFTLSLGLRKI